MERNVEKEQRRRRRIAVRVDERARDLRKRTRGPDPDGCVVAPQEIAAVAGRQLANFERLPGSGVWLEKEFVLLRAFHSREERVSVGKLRGRFGRERVEQ